MSLHWTSLHCDSAEQYLALCGRISIVAFAHQQPGGGDTPGVAVAPVALAGAIIPGVARFIVVHSAQADVFGVGATVIVGSRLVATSCVISGWIVPGVDSSKFPVSRAAKPRRCPFWAQIDGIIAIVSRLRRSPVRLTGSR